MIVEFPKKIDVANEIAKIQLNFQTILRVTALAKILAMRLMHALVCEATPAVSLALASLP